MPCVPTRCRAVSEVVFSLVAFSERRVKDVWCARGRDRLPRAREPFLLLVLVG